jgi:glutathione S-transferase
MKLYDSPRAPNPRRVRWFMAEKGIEDVEIVSLDILKLPHKEPDYLAKAGVPMVPALELEDGTWITESLAICRYLESRYPEPNLFGRTAEEVAVIEMWTRRAEMLLANPLMMGVRHTHPALAVLEEQDPAIAAYNTGTAERWLGLFDARLGESAWIAADRLTMADIVAFCGIDFGRLIKFRPAAELANLNRWLEAMRGRDAAKVAV